MPIYAFSCPACGAVTEHLLPLGDTAPRPCTTPDCPATMTLKLSRVAVTYQAFGLSHRNGVRPQLGQSLRGVLLHRDQLDEVHHRKPAA